MKRTLLSLLLIVALPALACDEECRRAEASAKYTEQFPGYLSWQYCDGIATDFMTSTLSSLQNYRDKRLQQRSKRGMHNTKGYIVKRQDWLAECDNYLRKTDRGRIFRDDTTTENIFAAMESVTNELDSLMRGVTYSSATGQDSTAIAAEKFDHFFKLVDTHKTLLLLKGQFVQRSR